MSSSPAIARHAGTIRLREVEHAVLDVLEARSTRTTRSIAFVEIDVSMDARGYSTRWVRRAIASLIDQGVIEVAGSRSVQRIDGPRSGRSRDRKPKYRRPRRILAL
jgi:hypothetical protein